MFSVMKIITLNFIALILLLIFFVPVILLALATSVPAMIWYSLVVFYLGLMMLLISYPWPKKFIAGIIFAGVGLSALAFLASDRYAATPTIKDLQGEIIPESVASLERVQLGDTDQWITVRSKDKNNPILLFLAGGPGWGELAWTRLHLSGLEDHFIVINWDQPGAGKSYRTASPRELSLERYLSDAVELVELLQLRSGQSKIYLLGESWGSYLGVRLVQMHPEYFYAYIGSGQIVNFTENDIFTYRFALEIAQQHRDEEIFNKLTENGPPPYYGVNGCLKYWAYMNYLNRYMYASTPGGGTPTKDLMDVLYAPEYSLMDKINWPLGAFSGFYSFYPSLNGRDLKVEAPRLDIPVYFVHGRYDRNSMPALIEQYYEALDAPSKKLIWFKNSRHTPHYEETGKFLEVMIDQVLKETYPGK